MNSKEFLDLIPFNGELNRFESYEDISLSNINSLSLVLSASFLRKPRKIAVCLPTLYDAQTLMDGLMDYLNQDDVVFYPFDEVLRIESIGTSKEMVEERINALTSTCLDKPVIFITHSAATIRLIRSKETFQSRIFTLEINKDISRKELLEKISLAGYTRVNKVQHCFEYALRGEILDIWSANYLDPIRIEFFDETVEEIRVFHPETEISYKQIESITIVPASEFSLSKEEKEDGSEKLLKALSERKLPKLLFDELSERVRPNLDRILNEGMDETNSRYLLYFDDNCKTVSDYLSEFQVYIYHPIDFLSSANNFENEEIDFFNDLYKNGQALEKERIYDSPKEVLLSLNHVNITNEECKFKTVDISYHNTNLATSTNFISNLIDDGNNVKICLTNERRETLINHLDEENVAYSIYPEVGRIQIVDFGINSGFLISSEKEVFLSSNEIFGLAKQSGKFLTRFKEAKILKKFDDLEIGDFVVHEDYGIGKYIGVFDLNGLDYLKVQYAGEDNYLYVPLSKFKLIRKYAGKEGSVPSLDEIGGTSWARRKEKIKKRVSYLADKLLAINAERMAKPGYAFMHEEEMEHAFANDFPYKLTDSQQKAWDDISKDMESPHPMDRLLAGDVGFGKTEIAFRACYKAILSGKQAAILCPTTILAKQHNEVAIKRFKGYGVEIAMLSRFTPKKEIENYIKRIKEGRIHLIIGTHKILGSEIEFNNLGLLVIDEEQRFGVTHKERIKEITTNIDVLTLSATPIPRTLQMSLLNVKSLSLLTQAPQNRMPIKTYVTKYDEGLIKEVIARELGRGGQVYYLHNRIDSIYSKAKKIQDMFPSCVVKVVHGALSADEIGDVMNEFYDGDIDILVCTTIIETGLDIPNVNTIIVEDADHFGLAQLYQIKGRVGRSNRLAYAYLFYKEYNNLSEQGQKRLKAIKDFTELGSGYKIANQDLNIRGAGDILGKEQAGFIDSVGYDAYMKLLQEVMNEKNISDKSKENKPLIIKYELSFSLDSHIPPSYASDSDRISMYQELNEITTFKDLQDYEAKIRDIYGPIPEEVRNLFLKKEIEIYLNDTFVENFVENIDKYIITISPQFMARDGVINLIEKALSNFSNDIIVRFTQKRMIIYVNRTPDYLVLLYNILSSLYSIKNN